MEIKSPQNQMIKDLIKLKTKKYRDKTNTILVEGDHLIEEASVAGLIIKTLGNDNDDIIINDIVSSKLSLTSSGSKRFALINKPQYKLNVGKRYLVLDGVQDPGNVGTLIRSAYSFGFDFVILSLDSADEYNDKTVRSSQGSVFHIPCLRMELSEIYAYFKKNNIKTYATHVEDKSLQLESVNTNESLAVVMGSEGSGVSELTLKSADSTLHIETSKFESLNVAIAGGIICYRLRV